MTTITSTTTTIEPPFENAAFDEAQLAAVSFLARYSGRTLEAYRHDLRGFLQWATDTGVDVLAATRGNIELFRAWMNNAGWRHPRSIDDCRRCAGSTGSRTSTAGSHRTRPSTCADPRSIRRTLARA